MEVQVDVVWQRERWMDVVQCRRRCACIEEHLTDVEVVTCFEQKAQISPKALAQARLTRNPPGVVPQT